MPDAEIEGRAYLRVFIADRPDAVGRVTKQLGDEAIGIEEVVVRSPADAPSGAVCLVVLTRRTTEARLRTAVEAIGSLPGVSEAPRLIRIEGEA
jgi:hypothetical protein